jgi:hypothetical protein
MTFVVLHMRSGTTIAYSPPDGELSLLTEAIRQRGFTGSMAVNDSLGQRVVNLAAVDWVEVKGAAS